MFICYFLYILIKYLRNRKLNIEKMSDKVFYLVYGIPGSGKSTYVEEQIKNKFKQLQHFEADMFFYLNESHTYNFDFKRLGSAHSWCKKHFVDAINQELPVCISNTSLTVKERNFYLKKAKEYNYKIYVHYCDNEFKNIHNVPDEKIQQMKTRLVKITEEEIKNFDIKFV